ncbi:hypothetical protein DM02DRAFT_167230 [Periconia macrospinosa]|uniref:Uncharacterized protein n=1 Tax=Periconia macrospinosa TaxID=97972 RepID=A0A2V1E4F1_9PLEO|nr:hypothetical protein DM02DRAFT_167230 [Periconia macrospinosa]
MPARIHMQATTKHAHPCLSFTPHSSVLFPHPVNVPVHPFACTCVHTYIHIHTCTHMNMSFPCSIPHPSFLSKSPQPPTNTLYTHTHTHTHKPHIQIPIPIPHTSHALTPPSPFSPKENMEQPDHAH